jgi:tetratricopeptide (TPR) repeat protein
VLALGAVTWGLADYQAAQAYLAVKQKDHATALEHLLRAAEIDPRSGEIQYRLGLAYLDNWRPKKSPTEQKRLIEAGLTALSRACVLNPMSHHYQLARADALDATGKHDEALEAYAIGIEAATVACFMLHECATTGAPIFANLGRGLRRAGNSADAVRAYRVHIIIFQN